MAMYIKTMLREVKHESEQYKLHILQTIQSDALEESTRKIRYVKVSIITTLSVFKTNRLNRSDGARAEMFTMANPDARAAIPWNNPARILTPTGIESVTGSPLSKQRMKKRMSGELSV